MGGAARREPASPMTRTRTSPTRPSPTRTSPTRTSTSVVRRVGGQSGAAMVEWVGVALVLAAIAVAVLHSPLPRTVHCAVLANVVAQRGGGGEACGRPVPPAPGTGAAPADPRAPVAP